MTPKHHISLILACIVTILIAAASAPSAHASDIEILVGDQPFKDSYTLKPGQQIEITTKIDAGVLIKEANIKSSNPLFQDMLGHAFESEQFHRDAVMQENKATITLPPILPSGTSTLSIDIKYDKDFSDNEFKAATSLEVDGGSRMLWLASKLLTDQTATELSNWLTGYKIPRANPELTMDDLTETDLTELGITNEDYLQTIALVKEASDLRAAGKTRAAETTLAAGKGKLPIIKEIASKEIRSKLGELKVKSPKAEEELGGPLMPQVTLTQKTYIVTAGDKKITKSKITISVTSNSNGGVSRVGTVVFIPKEVAQVADEIGFGQKPAIVDPDPVVKWAFKNIPQDQAKDYTFTVNKDVQNFEILAGATAEKPSLMFRIIKWIIEKVGGKP